MVKNLSAIAIFVALISSAQAAEEWGIAYEKVCSF